MQQKEQAVEPHPFNHSWDMLGDFVHQRVRGLPSVVRREEKCKYCPTARLTRIDVKTWTQIRKRSYRYAKGVVIVRIPRAEFLKNEFLATTTLTGADLEAIRR